MNRTVLLAVLFVLMLSASRLTHAAPKVNGVETAKARVMLEDIDVLSGTVANTAFMLGEMAKDQRDPQSHLDGLAVLREDINKIGSDLAALEAEEASLPPWEAKALDQTVPLIREVADDAEQAIQTFNSSRQRLWATSYVDNTAKISEDAEQVKTMLRAYLNLDKTREKEQKLEHALAQPSGF